MIKECGFTLIEILIALAVFATLATISSSAMYYAFNTRARIIEQASQLNTIQMAIIRIQQDVTQVINREIRSQDMRVLPAFTGDSHAVEFTRGGVANYSGIEKRSTLLRVSLICQDKQLIRRTWTYLDTPLRKNYQDQLLLDHLEQCQFAFINQNLQILTEWHGHSIQQNQHPEPLPKAIQFNFSLQNKENMSLLFIIPEALYVEK